MAKTWKESSVIVKIMTIITVAILFLGAFVIYWMPFQVIVDADRVRAGKKPLIINPEVYEGIIKDEASDSSTTNQIDPEPAH